MKKMLGSLPGTALAGLIMAAPLLADDGADSGFLSDYSRLKPVAGNDIRIYRVPGADTRFQDYRATKIEAGGSDE